MQQLQPLRLVILGMHIESGTFNPQRSTEEDFHTLRGQDLMERYPFLEAPHNRDLCDGISWMPTVHFRAMPGGAVSAASYANMKAEMVNRLTELISAEPIDGIYFDIHGAMAVEGIDDAELDGYSASSASI